MSQLQMHDSFEPYFEGRENAMPARRWVKVADAPSTGEQKASLKSEPQYRREPAEQRH